MISTFKAAHHEIFITFDQPIAKFEDTQKAATILFSDGLGMFELSA